LNFAIDSYYSDTGFVLSIQEIFELTQNRIKYTKEIMSSRLLRLYYENAFLLENITFPLNGTPS